MPWNAATLSILVVGVQGDSSCTLQRVDSHGLSFSRFKQLQRNGRPFVVHSFDIVPELASSRDELLEAFGNVKVQLESGIDEASAFFRLTKATLMRPASRRCSETILYCSLICSSKNI